MNSKVVRRSLLLGMLVASFAIAAIPVHADFSGYVFAPYGTSWTVTWGKWKHADIAGGTARRWWTHMYFDNVGSFPLTDALVTVRTVRVRLKDGTVVTDPTQIKTLVYPLNSNQTWDRGWYNGWPVVDVGTIQPGHRHKQLFNWWTADNVYNWGFYIALWYLP